MLTSNIETTIGLLEKVKEEKIKDKRDYSWISDIELALKQEKYSQVVSMVFKKNADDRTPKIQTKEIYGLLKLMEPTLVDIEKVKFDRLFSGLSQVKLIPGVDPTIAMRYSREYCARVKVATFLLMNTGFNYS